MSLRPLWSVAARPEGNESGGEMIKQTTKVRLLLVDDHEVVRMGLSRMLSVCEELEVVAVASTGQEALRLVQKVHPDLMLLDLRLPDIHGLEVLHSLAGISDPPKVLVLTVHDDSEIVVEAVRGGADGYVLKDASQEKLLGAIKSVAAGEKFFDSVVVQALLETDRHTEEEDLLSERELEVLRFLASGFTNKEIAQQLFLSTDTVKTHLSNIYRKLGVSDRAHAVAVALRRGLLE